MEGGGGEVDKAWRSLGCCPGCRRPVGLAVGQSLLHVARPCGVRVGAGAPGAVLH